MQLVIGMVASIGVVLLSVGGAYTLNKVVK